MKAIWDVTERIHQTDVNRAHKSLRMLWRSLVQCDLYFQKFHKLSIIHCGNETRTRKVKFDRFLPKKNKLQKCLGLFLKMSNLHIIYGQTVRLKKLKILKKPSKVYQFVIRIWIKQRKLHSAIILQITSSF